MMKHILRIVAILLMLCCLLVLIPSGTMVASAEIIEYDLKDKKGVPLQADGYDLENLTYEDPSISVKIEKGRFMETNYVVAYVKIAGPTQLRSTMSGSYHTDDTIMGTSMAKSTNAALAINGDYFSDTQRRNSGYVARMGKEYRNKCNGTYDVMVLDNLGDMHIIKAPTKEEMVAFKAQLEAEGKSIINGYTFGPGLIIDGERRLDLTADMSAGLIKAFAANRSAQRMCLGQLGPLEYICICSEGPEDPGSVGLTLDQFSELVGSFEGIQNAYNLDGGSSSTMVFNRDKINSPKNPKRRPLKDIIYFCRAYQPE